MALDLSGNTLAQIMAANGLGPPALPSNPTTDQVNAYNAAITAQAKAYSIILTYISQNAIINTVDTVPATGIKDSVMGNCTGTASGTGVGTIS